jgi:hypothetical protein
MGETFLLPLQGVPWPGPISRLARSDIAPLDYNGYESGGGGAGFGDPAMAPLPHAGSSAIFRR